MPKLDLEAARGATVADVLPPPAKIAYRNGMPIALGPGNRGPGRRRVAPAAGRGSNPKSCFATYLNR